MPRDAAELAHRLARAAEAVCRRYLSNGRRQGRYWLVGDVRNTPGRSMFVRLKGPESGRGAAGKWTDASTGEHGDLLDVIRESCGLIDFRDVADEARRFLSLPSPEPVPPKSARAPAPTGSAEAARRLFAMAQPIGGTLAEKYLRYRGITALRDTGALRFHPCCYYRPDEGAPKETWPAIIAAVTDLAGRLTGVHRTWLDPRGFDPVRLGKAPIETPRRAMGELLGNAVRFGITEPAPAKAGDVLAAGEGIETMLSLRCVLPTMPMVAALSANHLAAFLLPLTLHRLYIARDADRAGEFAVTALSKRAEAAGIEALALSPRLGDFNEDLRGLGIENLRAHLQVQLAPQDVARFMLSATAPTG
jgi:Toprim domain